MSPRRLAAVAAVSCLLLASCTPSSDEPTVLETFAVIDPSEAPLETATLAVEAEGAGECLVGSWTADLPDLGNQIDWSTDIEGTATQVSTEGSLEMVIDASGTISYGGPFTFITDTKDDIGTTMRIILEHSGQITSRWSLSGDQVALTGTDHSFWTVTPQIFINGMELGDPTIFDSLYDAAIQDGKMTVSCSGDSLLTQPQGSPYVTSWERQ